MPLLADTIVECGRRTLTNAINLANCWGRDQHGRWKGCEVIYGDTDSIFVRLPGRSVHEAFVFGEEFCKTVTKNNPPPVELKLEKVYLGSIMQTKKKYCGMKFESKEQKKPEFEAKGIETIRRDQCALTQKVLRNALKTLFSSGLGAVKEYLTRQWRLIDSGKLSIADFILTGRVRSKYRKSLPVQAALARRLTEVDPGRIVRHKERLAYVIVAAPGTAVRLSDSAMTPLELLEHWDLHSLNTTYYITKHVNAALQRCLGLSPHNVDVHEWYRTTPKPRKRIHFWPSTGRSSMISFFFGSDICWFCSRKSKVTGRSHVSVCAECRSTQARSVETTLRRMNSIQQDSLGLAQKCSRCNLCFEDARTFAALEPRPEGTKTKVQAPLANCTCIDCPIFYQRHRAREDELEMQAVFQALGL
jgi:DNA polymerase zeta